MIDCGLRVGPVRRILRLERDSTDIRKGELSITETKTLQCKDLGALRSWR
jgi:hypothetical protein